MLYADDAALTAHTKAGLQDLINCFSEACSVFGLTISIKKTNVLGQNVSPAPSISIGDSSLEECTYLGSVISSSLNLDLELNGRIGKASSIMGRLSRRVGENTKLTTNTKIAVYQACVLSTLMYGSECWTLHSRQEQRLNSFHLRCIRRILGISWQQNITNDEVFKRVGIPSMFSILGKRRIRWLCHVARMEDGRKPKDILYGELATDSRPAGKPTLRYKDVCKHDLRTGDIAHTDLEALAADKNVWRLTTKSAAVKIEQKLKEQHEMKRQRRRVRAASDTLDDTAFVCPTCKKTCRSRIGLYSQSRRCSSTTE